MFINGRYFIKACNTTTHHLWLDDIFISPQSRVVKRNYNIDGRKVQYTIILFRLMYKKGVIVFETYFY